MNTLRFDPASVRRYRARRQAQRKRYDMTLPVLTHIVAFIIGLAIGTIMGGAL